MLKQFDKPYNPQEVEEKIYKLWEESGFFNPDNLPKLKIENSKLKIKSKSKSFSIIMPPPNANGSLHLGHALMLALEDIMVRYYRMKGYKTLWLPGADHAGFETQVVYEKKLEKEGRNRFEIPRDQLYKEIFDFTQTNKKHMENQVRRLGASCDWSREKFTLDEDIISKTQDTFIQLYKDGLVYRGNRLVHWCPKHQTGFSDLEINHEEKLDPLYYIKYGPLTVATVRPETIFGDTAVAVNPKDKRYKNLIGKEIEVDVIVGKLKLKVIADSVVDSKFGTGAVKVTPAHDSNDYEIWQRHKDEIKGPVEVINKYAKMDLIRHFPQSDEAKKYEGLKVLEARKLIVEDLEKRGLIEKIDSTYRHNVALCYKCKNMIEPRLMSQWFIKMEPLAKPAIEAVKKGEIKFVPDRFKKVYFHWLKNIRDWNISRQIVWGIRIPAWFCMQCGDVKINPRIKSKWYIVRHGETDWNREGRHMGQNNISLNKTGIEQVQKAANELKDKNIDLIISSDIKRCRETAEIINKELKTEIIFDKNLRERHMGEWQGLLIEEIKMKHQLEEDEQYQYEHRISGGESYKDLEERVFTAFEEHNKNHKHSNIVIVSHGGPIRAIKKKIKNKETGILVEPAKNAEIFELIISQKSCKCGSDFIEQDKDVFDTWFSSGQWPFLALGFKESSGSSKSKIKNQKSKITDYEKFYPTSVMETGWDILFFWVARMVMLGLYRTKKIPFKHIYLHGLVRDEFKQKMSKSKGNVIDPLGIVNDYGADALRMALVVGNTPGNDLAFSEDKIRGYRNFANKVWQASRFVLMNLENFDFESKPKLSAADKKKLSELAKIKKEISKSIESFKFYDAAEKIYHYFWHTFCDEIIEEMKPRLKSEDEKDKQAAQFVLFEILKESLKMLHPFMPFITEEIWNALPLKDRKMLIIEQW